MAFRGCTGLTSIECRATLPPSLESNVFHDVPKNIPLYVPDESVTAYQNANQWKDFLDIRPLSTVSIEANSSYELLVYPNPVKDLVFIKGIGQNAVLKIYDINGRQIYFKENPIENQSIDISFFPSGIYMFKIFDDGKICIARVLKE